VINMVQSKIKKSLLAVTLSAAALGVAGTTQAAIYAGHWDPAYGPTFPSLGWEVTAMFDVPSSCLGQSDGSYLVSGNCAGFKVLSAEVDFYNNSFDSNPMTSPVVESFALATSPLVINGIDIAGGKLAGINTGYFTPFVPVGNSKPIAGAGNYGFSLILYDMHAQLLYAALPAAPFCPTPTDGVCGYSENAAKGTFMLAAVPEPETYAMMLAGLAAVGFMTRRRRA